ncbi:DNA polymerase III subunit delta [soil metagenome]
MLTGDPFLAEEAVARVRDQAGADPLAEVWLDAGVEAAELATVLGTASLLGGRRLVILRDASSLKKDQVETLGRYLENPSPGTVLVLVAPGKTKLDGAARKVGAVLALEPPRGRKLAAWVRQRATAAKLRLDDRAAWALIDSVGTELRDLAEALEQLLTRLGPGSRVDAPEVRRAFGRLADQRVYVLTDAVGDRDLARAMTSLRRLLLQGEEPLVLFGALAAHLRRLLRVRRLAGAGGRAAGEALAMPAWRAERMVKQALAYEEGELIAAVTLLSQADFDLKGGDLPPAAVLERAVVEILTGAGRPALFG